MKLVELEDTTLAIRDYISQDRSFVVSTWLKSHQENAKVARPIFKENHEKIIAVLLARPEVSIKVACSPEMKSALCGWACGEGELLHYAYVPHTLRNMGLARHLIEAALGSYPERIEVTHRFHHFWPPKSHRFVFNPYKLGLVA